ncbi:MAG: OmpA family protein [Desulfatirhabdiaceae bacterium]
MNSNNSKKRNDSVSRTTSQQWQVTYSGFILMLLSFFIMLCSLSMMESSKITRFVKSFSTAESILSDGKRFEDNTIILPESPEMVDHWEKLAGIHSKIQNIITNLNMGDSIRISTSDAGIMMQFSDSVLFQSGFADLLPDARIFLQKTCSIILNAPYDIRIEGHTDNVPIRSDRFPSNWELSAARAINVMRYVLQSEGMMASRLSAAGFGEFRPICPNDSDVNRARNRRVEIYLVPSGISQRKPL